MGRHTEIFLRAPNGKIMTIPEAASVMGKKVGTVRSRMRYPKRYYMGFEILRPGTPAEPPEDEQKLYTEYGYRDITTEEFYMHYLDCVGDEDMIQKLRDFAGTKRIGYLLKWCEKRYKERTE